MAILPNSAAARDVAHVLHPTTNLAAHREDGPKVITRGKGIYVFDEDGREYIEGLSGLWCVALGFGEEELVEAAAEQMRSLSFYHGFGAKTTNPVIDLAERLKEMAPFEASKVFFTNSGSEANDTQIKLAWHYNNIIGRPDKKKIISRHKGYHGVTIATASLTGLPAYQRDFDVPIDRILLTDCPHHYRFAEDGESEEAFSTRLAENLERLIEDEGPDTVAAFFAEPVMGAGGVYVPPATYFEKIQDVLRRHDVMLIADEVICGFGRTGNTFGCETYGIEPDTMTVAKQMSSGYLPIAAVMLPEAMYEAFVEQSRKIGMFGHGFTYGGHPVSAAVALKTLEIMERRDILGHVRRVMPRFQERLAGLAGHPLVGEARGVGLIGAVEMVADKKTKRAFDPSRKVGLRAAASCEKEGLITRPLGDALALCPPLVISEAEIDELFDRLTRALDATEEAVEKEDLRAA